MSKEDKVRLLCSWSGGKDSCFALFTAIQQGYQPVALLNALRETGDRSRSHGLRKEFLVHQANALNLPIEFLNATWSSYEKEFISQLKFCKQKYKIDVAVFGDIDLEPHRQWERKVCKISGLTALLPLWQKDREALVFQMIDVGFQAIIVSCNKVLGESFLGKKINRETVKELQEHGVDVCGENGEYHTAVVDGPIFKYPIAYELGEPVTHENYCFIDMELTDLSANI